MQCINITDLCTELSIGRTKAYSLIKSGKIKSAKVGRKILIDKDDMERFLKEKMSSEN